MSLVTALAEVESLPDAELARHVRGYLGVPTADPRALGAALRVIATDLRGVDLPAFIDGIADRLDPR